MNDFIIRKATPDDAVLAAEFMKKLGTFQKMSDKTTVDAYKMKKLLDEKAGEAIFASVDGTEIAFMYYYYNSSAFTGGKGIYIDGLYVEEQYRCAGVGTKMINHIREIAREKGCSRLEWVCLDWNAFALDYYAGLGAERKDQLILHRLQIEERCGTC